MTDDIETLRDYISGTYPLTQEAALAALERVEKELHETRETLAGADADSLPNDYLTSRIADKRMEERDKFMWQVRDICARAEKAEAERDSLRANLSIVNNTMRDLTVAFVGEQDKCHALRAKIEKTKEALVSISSQHLTSEMDAEDQSHADFEGGYDTLIKIARAILAELSPDAPVQQTQISVEAVEKAVNKFWETSHYGHTRGCFDAEIGNVTEAMRAAITAAIEWGKQMSASPSPNSGA